MRPAEASADKHHAVGRFNVDTGEQAKAPPGPPTYTRVFADALIAEAEVDPSDRRHHRGDAVGHRARSIRASASPTRCFDVGIAEQHAVTFAAGLASEGMKPFCAIYSTFLQRAYDQVVHDVAIQSLPVRFAIDRAGLVGADGATHAGSFDLAYLGCLPGIVLMAPATRRNWCTWWRPPPRSTTARARCAIRAARAAGSPCRRRATCCRSAAGA